MLPDLAKSTGSPSIIHVHIHVNIYPHPPKPHDAIGRNPACMRADYCVLHPDAFGQSCPSHIPLISSLPDPSTRHASVAICSTSTASSAYADYVSPVTPFLPTRASFPLLPNGTLYPDHFLHSFSCVAPGQDPTHSLAARSSAPLASLR